jgi:hypothetical protein
MSRPLSAFALVAGLAAAQVGCHSCGDRPGQCTTARPRADAPFQTTGRDCGCGEAVGQPMTYGPEQVPAVLVPGGSPYPIPGGPLVPPSVELPMPAPSEMIRPPALPVPAPGDASLPYPTSPGVPVRGPNR